MTTQQIQRKNSSLEYNKHDYGIVLRASGIFYYKKSPSFKTTISFLNYWKIKRDLDVTAVASLRKMDGSLISREILSFKNSNVINYSPVLTEQDFEGSIEIEIFSLDNMVIPYAGIIGIYESENGISMVHSYGRIYSNYEIEEEKITMPGEEVCCNGIKDTNEVESFIIAHNGRTYVPSQKITMSILNHKGERKNVSFTYPPIEPFQTLKIRHRDFFPDLVEFLNNKPGFVSYSFKLNDCFTRMIVINQKVDGTDFQLTHSDFNLKKHVTSPLENNESVYMFMPRIQNTKQEIIIYPDCEVGNYQVTSSSGKSELFNENKAAFISLDDYDSEEIIIKKLDGSTPTRLHTGIKLSYDDQRLPAECCLGVYNKITPPKHFFWGLVCSNKNIKSQIILQQFSWKEKDNTSELPVEIKLYSDKNHKTLSATIVPKLLANGKYLTEIFPEADEFLGKEFGWFTLYSPSGYCMAYSTLENLKGSLTFEHTM